MSLYIDLTEFLVSLRKTGIERIGGEICRHAPQQALIPVRFHIDRYLSLPAELVSYIGEYFLSSDDCGITEIHRRSAVENGLAVRMSDIDTMLIPEIFAGQRAEFFRRMPVQEQQRYRFIIYDLLPATHPRFFPPDMPVMMSEYYRVVSRASHCAFISDSTRNEYYQRLRRTDDRGGIVFPLGSDALGARATQPALNRSLTFSVLGTVEPRKNHELILDAFEPLLEQIDGLSLWFIGRMGWVDPQFEERVRTLASRQDSGFRFFSAPDDNAIRGNIEQSRATIYVSAAEGYGLPPVESLWAGTPVIASTVIPSLMGVTKGVRFVEPLDIVNLRSAVLDFLEDDYANQKTEEAAQLNLPTWRSFTQEVLRWCRENGSTDSTAS